MTGLYAPLDEEVTAFDLPVVGALPVELDGRYLRNGPNPLGPVDPATYHWFTGDGMVHGVRLRDGGAEWYRNRWVRSTTVSEALGEAPAPGERHGGYGHRQHQRHRARRPDVRHRRGRGAAGRALLRARHDRATATSAARCPTATPPTRRSTRPPATCTPSPTTGRSRTSSTSSSAPTARVRQVEPIEVADGPMVHDCSITERWMVVYDLPVTFDLDAAMSGASFPYAWNEAHAARVGLVPLGGRGSDVRWFEVEPVLRVPPAQRLRRRRPRRARRRPLSERCSTATASARTRARRCCGAGRSTRRPVRSPRSSCSDVPLEFPRVDERLVGRRHRVGYASEVRRVDGSADDFGGRLVRIDGATGDAGRSTSGQAVSAGSG